jgi:hypothetical protein
MKKNEMYGLVNTMNIRNSQNNKTTAVATGSEMCACLQRSTGGLGDDLPNQYNGGIFCRKVLWGQKLTPNGAGSNVQSWIRKLVDSWNAGQFDIYRLRGTDSMGRVLAQNEELTLIAELAVRLRGRAGNPVSPKNFMASFCTLPNGILFYNKLSLGQAGMGQRDEDVPWERIASAAKSSVLIVDIRKGNCQTKCYGIAETIADGLSFDDDVPDYLLQWIPFLRAGTVWFFAAYRGEICLIRFNDV